MSEIKHTEKTVQTALEKRFDSNNIKYTVTNLYLFRHNWETDFLVVQKSGYCYEIEIKISRSDFLNDFKKVDKHSIMNEGTYLVKKYKYHTDPETKKRISEHYHAPAEWKFKPNKFYYCVPEGLVSKEEVPDYAGLMYVTKYGTVTTIKEPKFIHKEKLDLQKPLCDKFYYYWKNAIASNAILLEKLNESSNRAIP
jgi:hypothetical protein